MAMESRGRLTVRCGSRVLHKEARVRGTWKDELARMECSS